MFKNAAVFETRRWVMDDTLNEFGKDQIDFFVSRFNVEQKDEDDDEDELVCLYLKVFISRG